MSGIALRQVRAVIAVCEEGSFTRAAVRENATQSGISQHVSAVEGAVGVKAFCRFISRLGPSAGGLRPLRGLAPLAPVRLSACAPLKIVVPGPDNIRRRNLETYFHTHDVEVAAMLEMDAMIGTLEFVARSDWVTVLPSVISVNDIAKGDLVVSPIVGPPLHAEFVVIQPARRTLTTQARLFLEGFEAEVARIHAVWSEALDAPKSRRAKAGPTAEPLTHAVRAGS